LQEIVHVSLELRVAGIHAPTEPRRYTRFPRLRSVMRASTICISRGNRGCV
jgi:hypothetical protein